MTTQMQIRRGNAADRPTLLSGEFGLDTDTDDLWIGTPTGNLKVYPPVPRGDPALFGTPAANEFTYWHSATEVTGLPQVTWDAGNTRVALANTVGLQWTGRSILTSPDDGSLRLTNSAGNDAGSIIFGPSTIAFPRIKRDGVGLQARLANDSDWTTLTAGAFIGEEPYRLAEQAGVPGSIVGYGQIYCKAADSLLYYMDSAGSEKQLGTVQGSGVAGQVTYWDSASGLTGDTGLLWAEISNILQFGGSTANEPGLRANAAVLEARLADNSAGADFTAALVRGTQGVRADGGYAFYWGGASRMTSPSDGVVLFTNAAGTDFSRIALGGITAAHPALARHPTDLDAFRMIKADDSGQALLYLEALHANTYVQVNNNFRFSSKSRMYSDADGVITLTDNAGTDFDRLCLGGTTSSYPSIKRSSAQLVCRKADDSANAVLSMSTAIVDATGWFAWSTRCRMTSPADSVVLLTDNVGTDFSMLCFGAYGSASYPALKRSAAGLHLRLADDSDYANLTVDFLIAAKSCQIGASYRMVWANRSGIYSDADSTLTLTDNAGTDFSMLCFGAYGSASYPALKRNAASIECRLSNDAGRANILASGGFYTDRVQVGASFYYEFAGRSRMWSDADGNIRLTDAAGTDFSRLCLGGSTSSYPALKRSGAGLHVRLADDSDYAGVTAQACQVAAGFYFRWAARSQMYSDADGTADIRTSGGAIGAWHTGRDVEANTAVAASPNVLTDLESYKILTNEGVTAQNYHDLPSAVAGMQYTFVVQDSDGIRVTAATGDTIRVAGSVSAAAGYVASTTIGDALTLVAINATEWVAIQQVGTGWAVT